MAAKTDWVDKRPGDPETPHNTVYAAGLNALGTEVNSKAATADLAGKQDADADLTALAALTSPATKLAGIATGATANDTDANLKARANHTGGQAALTISDSTASGRAVLTGDQAAGRAALDAAPSTGSAYYRRARTVSDTNGVDDRAAIQTILNEGAGEVVFRSGQTWTIDTTITTGGISPLSGTRIIIEDGAVLKTKTNANTHGRLIDIGRDGAVQNITVEGSGTLLGDLLTHTGTTGEYGHLINITNGSSNIQVVGSLLLKQAWGDGIYIGGAALLHDVLIDGVTVEDCRREGIAPFWVDGCTIRNTRVLNTGLTAVTAPGSGIDAEPNSGELVDYLTIENNYIEGTAGSGIYVSANPGPVTNLIIRDNEIVNCGLSSEAITTYQVNGIHVAGISRPQLIDNIVRGSGYDGDPNGTSGQIYLRGATRPVVRGGYLAGGLGRGLFLSGCTAPEASDVTSYNNAYHGIFATGCNDAVIRNNYLDDNVQSNVSTIEHLSVQSSNNAIIQGNVLRGIKGHSWVRIETSGNDNLVINNVGVGVPPTNGPLVDDGTRTVKSGNFRKDTSVYTAWSSDDAAAMGPSPANANADLLGWTYDPATILTGSVSQAAATMYFCRIALRAPQTITNVVVYMNTVGSTLTNAFVALFKSDGTILRQSADQSTAWGSGGTTGPQTVALTSPVAVTPTAPNDFVWAVIYVGAATTLPTFARGVSGNATAINLGTTTSRRRYGSAALASTATLTSVTPSSMSSASNALWMALS